MPVTASAVARVVGIDTHFKNLRGGAAQSLPQQIGILAQGNTASAGYSLLPRQITSAGEAALAYGFGSPIHLAALECYPPVGGGVGSIPVWVFPLVDDGAGVAAVGTITPAGAAPAAATFFVRISGILSSPIAVAAAATVATQVASFVAAINAILGMPALATNTGPGTACTLTAKWKGATGNEIKVEILDANLNPALGSLYTVVTPATGAADPNVTTALAGINGQWITLLINSFHGTNATVLDAIALKGEARWDQQVRRPFVAICGNDEAVLATATATTAARKTDRVNCQVVSPGSVHLPVQIAAAHVREIAKVADGNPPTGYGARPVTTLLPGADAVQWDYATRDAAVKAGSSTTELKNGQVNISDVVTMYHPDGEIPPAYRYVVDIVKLMTVIYNLDLEFGQPEWASAPLIPDGQPTVNPNARKPSSAKAAVNRILDGLGLEAVISDPATAKATTTANISSTNPKRLDVSTTVQLSGNTEIISVDLNFGFFFGSAAAA
jgi:phage tail sheath gpL-like